MAFDDGLPAEYTSAINLYVDSPTLNQHADRHFGEYFECPEIS